jgi:hypothetical protein
MEITVLYCGLTKRGPPCNISETILKTSNPGLRASGRAYLLKAIVPALLLLATLTFSTGSCLAQDNDESLLSGWTTGWDFEQLYVYSSLYTKHYDPDPDHVNDQNMLGFEGQTRDQRVMGLAVFDNSFGQESQYLYLGQKWRAFSTDRWYYKLTGGLLNGYEEPYEDKVPLNGLGVAPALVPTLGYKGKSFAVEFSQLGFSAGMLTAGLSF